jgi:hypothetical protein
MEPSAEQQRAFAEINETSPIVTWRFDPHDLTIRYECDNGDVGTIDTDGIWEWDDTGPWVEAGATGWI